MPSPARPALRMGTAAALTACMSLAACASTAGPTARARGPASASVNALVARLGPRAGSHAEASTLATQLLSRLHMPAGATRLPPNPMPSSVDPSSVWGLAATSLDVHELFDVPELMPAAAAFLSAHMPPGMSLSNTTGTGIGYQGRLGSETPYMDVVYEPRTVPSGVNAAQIVLTIAPDTSGGSLVRVDAQVIWYPPRSAGEYIDPARYQVLTVEVTIFNPQVHRISKTITSRAPITELADALNRSEVEPLLFDGCPASFATYRLAFAVSLHTAPVVVVTANQSACLGAQISVDGRKQPPVQDAAAVVAIADQLLGFTPRS